MQLYRSIDNSHRRGRLTKINVKQAIESAIVSGIPRRLFEILLCETIKQRKEARPRFGIINQKKLFDSFFFP